MVRVHPCHLKIIRELKKFPSKNNGGPFENRFVPELNDKEVIELLEDLPNILGAFLIQQFFNSRLFDRR